MFKIIIFFNITSMVKCFEWPRHNFNGSFDFKQMDFFDEPLMLIKSKP